MRRYCGSGFRRFPLWHLRLRFVQGLLHSCAEVSSEGREGQEFGEARVPQDNDRGATAEDVFFKCKWINVC